MQTALAQSSSAVTPGGNGSTDSTPYGGSLLNPPGVNDPCAFGQPTCVLTGQYNRFRTSTNTYAPILAGLSNTDNFSAKQFLQFDTLDVASGFNANPTMAQPLYVNNVLISGTRYEILIVASLNDSVYAFNAANGNVLWKRTPNSTGNLWPLYGNCAAAGTAPQPFVPDSATNIGVFTLPYYGIVSTPVIDLSQTAPPVLYTVSACIPDATSTNKDKISWYLNAIDVSTGQDLITSSNHPSSSSNNNGGYLIAGTNGEAFKGGNHMQRPALLFTNPSSTNYYLYASFGTGIFEIDSSNRYHGWAFGYKIAYGSSPLSVTPTLLGPSGGAPFSSSSSNSVTSVFPPASNKAFPFTVPATPQNYPSCNTANGTNSASNCFHGDNWVGPGSSAGTSGGIWMSGKGPSSDATGNVYFAAGNGAFDCSGSTGCTDPTQVLNWGESAVQLPPGSNTSPMAPTDFYTPWTNNYSNDTGASYQYQALNRYDLDFGTPGAILFDAKFSDVTQTYAITADKTGFAYAMPINAGSVGMGRFRSGDSGLTSGAFKSQAPFLANRAGIASAYCPSALTSPLGYFNGTNCNEIHELAWWRDLLFVWPWNEAALVYKGSPVKNGTNNYTYSFSLLDNPCSTTMGKGIGTDACSNTDFPVAGYPGAMMAVAADSTGATPKATLWAVATIQGSDNPVFHYTGTLYSYTIATTGTALTKLFPGLSIGACTGAPAPLPLSSWKVSPFAEPTLANDKVYVPVYWGVSGLNTISGVLVFGKC